MPSTKVRLALLLAVLVPLGVEALLLAVHVGGLGLSSTVLVPIGEGAMLLAVDEGGLLCLRAVLVPKQPPALRAVVAVSVLAHAPL